MAARSPSQARFLGLWTAGWLALLLVLGMVRFGDPAVQWPVLVVPVLWALVALRPRRGGRAGRRAAAEWPEEERADDRWPEDDRWADDRWSGQDGWPEDDGWAHERRRRQGPRHRPPLGERTDTVERPALRRRPEGTDHRW
ncbi:hypothetical protein ACI792_01140 [Blastococcus sp. SYSU DS0669]